MKKWVGWLTLVILITAMAELTSFAIYQRILVPRAAFLVYIPPSLLDQEPYKHYLAQRDPVLGWPNKQAGPLSSRPSPTFPQTEGACLSLYGDSFVYAAQVSDEAAWGNLLAAHLKCPVINYGVSGELYSKVVFG